jgi:hypothetical protein
MVAILDFWSVPKSIGVLPPTNSIYMQNLKKLKLNICTLQSARKEAVDFTKIAIWWPCWIFNLAENRYACCPWPIKGTCRIIKQFVNNC